MCFTHVTCLLHAMLISCLLQIWSMKQDKYVYDLREHSKVLVIQFHVLEFIFLFHLDYNLSVLFSGNIHHKMESHWTGYKQSEPAVSVG